MNRIRTGSHYFLRPIGSDATDPRVTHWKDYIVKVIKPPNCPKEGTTGRYYVETRQGEYIGQVLLDSLEPLDRKSKAAIARENRRRNKSIRERRKQYEEQVAHPGKFEGCEPYIPFYHDVYLNGGGEYVSDQVHKFKVEPNDRILFPELKRRRTVKLYFSDSGFVSEA